MGKEAKRRAAERAAQEEALSKVDIPRLAAAIRKLCTAASGLLGSDCGLHAELAKGVLSRLGINAEVRAGHAAWRVGNGDGDVIAHTPVKGMLPQPGIACHMWLEIGDMLLDLTTYQLPAKAKRLDSQDGGHTTVEWCPDFLCVPRKTISSYYNVRCLQAGLYFYQADQWLMTQLLPDSKADPSDIEVAYALYLNPEIIVMGPNNIPL